MTDSVPSLSAILDSPLIRESGDLWKKATTAEFLNAVESGTVGGTVFSRWLVQDYFFAQGLTSFQAVLTAKVPRSCHKPVIAGLVALDSELDWFEEHAGWLGLELSVEPHPTCRHYVDFLLRAAYTEPYPVLLAILFGIEVSYLAAWSALNAEGPYAEFIERWSNERFVDYVRSLQRLTEEHSHPDQLAAFRRVLEFEDEFWQMSWEG
jgi:thiaminase/transcriptional activator TenA